MTDPNTNIQSTADTETSDTVTQDNNNTATDNKSQENDAPNNQEDGAKTEEKAKNEEKTGDESVDEACRRYRTIEADAERESKEIYDKYGNDISDLISDVCDDLDVPDSMVDLYERFEKGEVTLDNLTEKEKEDLENLQKQINEKIEEQKNDLLKEKYGRDLTEEEKKVLYKNKNNLSDEEKKTLENLKAIENKNFDSKKEKRLEAIKQHEKLKELQEKKTEAKKDLDEKIEKGRTGINKEKVEELAKKLEEEDRAKASAELKSGIPPQTALVPMTAMLAVAAVPPIVGFTVLIGIMKLLPKFTKLQEKLRGQVSDKGPEVKDKSEEKKTTPLGMGGKGQSNGTTPLGTAEKQQSSGTQLGNREKQEGSDVHTMNKDKNNTQNQNTQNNKQLNNPPEKRGSQNTQNQQQTSTQQNQTISIGTASKKPGFSSSLSALSKSGIMVGKSRDDSFIPQKPIQQFKQPIAKPTAKEYTGSTFEEREKAKREFEKQNVTKPNVIKI